jgi:hypothetical protein
VCLHTCVCGGGGVGDYFLLVLFAQRCYRVTCNDLCETLSATEILIFLLLHCVYMYSTHRGGKGVHVDS